MIAWLLLLVAGLLEVSWAIGLKYTQGLTRIWPSILTILLSIASFVCLAKAVQTIPVGTGYAVWTGIGAVGTAALGIILFSEDTSPTRLFCLVLIVIGIVGLKITTKK